MVTVMVRRWSRVLSLLCGTYESVIALSFQLVDQLADPSYLGTGCSPDVSPLHFGKLNAFSEANGRKDCFGPGRKKPPLLTLTDRTLHLKIIWIHLFSFPPTLDTNQNCSILSTTELLECAFLFVTFVLMFHHYIICLLWTRSFKTYHHAELSVGYIIVFHV